MAIKRILVPVDFSPASLHGLEYAIDFAKPLKAGVEVLFVVEPVYYAALSDLDGTSTNLQRLLNTQRRAGEAELARLTLRLKKRGVSCHSRVEVGQPFTMIVGRAKSLKADLIIMATHGRTGLSHMFLGSVAERVVRTAECPVLTVRHHPPAARRRRAVRPTGPARR